MFDDVDKQSFRLDPKAKSFHLTGCHWRGYRWRDILVLIVCVVFSFSLLTGFNFMVSLLPREVTILIVGIGFVYLACTWVAKRRATARTPSGSEIELPQLPQLSDRVKEIASHPDRKIEAIKVYREESGVGLAEAKKMVEAYIDRDR